MTSRLKSPRRARRGDSVLVLAVPPSVKTAPLETRRAFKLAVGHQFKVQGIDEMGQLELMVGRVVDRAVGGFMNTIWIEPECVRLVRRKRAG